MRRNEAKRVAYEIAAELLTKGHPSAYAHPEGLDPSNGAKIYDAMLELADEMQRRATRLPRQVKKAQ